MIKIAILGSHASPRHGGKERIPVAVKAVRVIMGMGIKNRHSPLPRSFLFQYTRKAAV